MKVSERVADAARQLGPYFGVSGVRPKFVVDSRSRLPPYYDSERRRIRIHTRDVHFARVPEYVVGEEVGHSMHHRRNPASYARLIRPPLADNEESWEDFLLRRAFVELVGSYAGLVYAEKTGRARHAVAMLMGIADEVRKQKEALERPATYKELVDKIELFAHGYGYADALAYYGECGDRWLGMLAQVPCKKAVEMMKKNWGNGRDN